MHFSGCKSCAGQLGLGAGSEHAVADHLSRAPGHFTPTFAGLPPSDSLLSMPSAPSLGPGDVSTVAAAAEGTTGSATWADEAMGSTAPSSPPLSPRHPPSRLRRVVSASRSSGGSREGSRHGSSSHEGSRHGGGFAALALGVPHATPELQVAEEGVHATAGAIAVAGIAVAAEALEELEEGVVTPTGAGELAAAGGVEAVAHRPARFEGPRWVRLRIHRSCRTQVPC